MEITTLRTTAGSCPDVNTCPSIDLIDTRPGRVYFVGQVEEDPEILAAYKDRLGPGEAVFSQPTELHPEIAP